MNRRESEIWFSSLLFVSYDAKQALLSRLSGPEEISGLTAKQAQMLLEEAGFQSQVEKMADRVAFSGKEKVTEDALRAMEKNEMKFAYYTDSLYPGRLLSEPYYPHGLFYKGNLPMDEERTCAIIGSRVCTYYGRNMAEKVAREAVKCGISVVSGLARGIDSAGHEGAIYMHGKTYAVLGCGVDVVYPPENIRLYDKILEYGGGILSEFAPGTKPLGRHFPQRNRIISGLSDQVLVMEAGACSGSLITAGYALASGKEIWALPGRVGDKTSVGTNELIRDGSQMLLSPEDFTAFLRENTKKSDQDYENSSKDRRNALDKNQEVVYSLLDSAPNSVDMICMLSGFSIQETVQILVKLEELGYARQVSEGYYVVR